MADCLSAAAVVSMSAGGSSSGDRDALCIHVCKGNDLFN